MTPPIKHQKGLHPCIKKHFDFSNDKFAWYWIYFKGRIFNTYDWYIAKRTKNYIVWKNYYWGEKGKEIITSLNKIKKVVCWKVAKRGGQL